MINLTHITNWAIVKHWVGGIDSNLKRSGCVLYRRFEWLILGGVTETSH